MSHPEEEDVPIEPPTDFQFAEGLVTLSLHQAPRSGRVAYVVWPVARFAVDTLAAWRALEVRRGAADALRDPSDATAAALAREYGALPPGPARRMLLERGSGSGVQPWKNLFDGVAVVELGSGTGAAGLAISALGASAVLLTDQSKTMGLLRENAALNGKRVGVRALDWQRWDGATSLAEVERDVAALLNESPPHTLMLLVSDCIYDVCHIGRSPLVPIIRDFLLLGSAASHFGSGVRRVVALALETRDAEVESSFFYQLAQISPKLRLQKMLDAKCEAPSEGNDVEDPCFQFFAITAAAE